MNMRVVRHSRATHFSIIIAAGAYASCHGAVGGSVRLMGGASVPARYQQQLGPHRSAQSLSTPRSSSSRKMMYL